MMRVTAAIHGAGTGCLVTATFSAAVEGLAFTACFFGLVTALMIFDGVRALVAGAA